jgi:hypothetical protein
MKNILRREPIPFFLAVLLVCGGCPPNPPIQSEKGASCDCTIYPFPNGCDSQCGIAEGVVESVSNNSVTVRMQARQGQHAEIKTIPLAALKLDPAALKAGTSVRLTYEKSATQPLTIKPTAIRSLTTGIPQRR